MSQAEFLKKCRGASVEDEKCKLYMNILLSSVEYETFVKLMYIMKPVAERRLAMEAEAKAMEERYGAEEGSKGAKGAKAAEDDADMKELEDLRVSDGRADAKQSRYDDDGDKASSK